MASLLAGDGRRCAAMNSDRELELRREIADFRRDACPAVREFVGPWVDRLEESLKAVHVMRNGEWHFDQRVIESQANLNILNRKVQG